MDVLHEGNGPLVRFFFGTSQTCTFMPFLNSGISVAIWLIDLRCCVNGHGPQWTSYNLIQTWTRKHLWKIYFQTRTFPSMSATLKPLTSISEMDTKFFLWSGTSKRFWGSLLSLKSGPFPWWPALPVIPLIIEDVLGMIVIFIKRCVSAVRTLLRMMAELIATKASAFFSILRSKLPNEVIFRWAIKDFYYAILIIC